VQGDQQEVDGWEGAHGELPLVIGLGTWEVAVAAGRISMLMLVMVFFYLICNVDPFP
jgi:hypothetical protein